MHNSKRVNLILPKETKDLIDQLADEKGQTSQEILRTYVHNGLLEEAVVREGGRIIAEMADGSTLVIANSVGKFEARNVKNLLLKKGGKG